MQRKLNAGNAELYGLEASVSARPTDRLQLFVGGTLMHSEFTDFTALAGNSYAGNRLINAPSLAASGGFSYSLPLANGSSIRASADAQYTSKVFLTPDNDPLGRVDPRALVNARLSWISPDERVEVALWGKNITNKRFVNFIAPIITSYELNYNDPGTYGIQLIFHSR